MNWFNKTGKVDNIENLWKHSNGQHYIVMCIGATGTQIPDCNNPETKSYVVFDSDNAGTFNPDTNYTTQLAATINEAVTKHTTAVTTPVSGETVSVGPESFDNFKSKLCAIAAASRWVTEQKKIISTFKPAIGMTGIDQAITDIKMYNELTGSGPTGTIYSGIKLSDISILNYIDDTNYSGEFELTGTVKPTGNYSFGTTKTTTGANKLNIMKLSDIYDVPTSSSTMGTNDKLTTLFNTLNTLNTTKILTDDQITALTNKEPILLNTSDAIANLDHLVLQFLWICINKYFMVPKSSSSLPTDIILKRAQYGIRKTDGSYIFFNELKEKFVFTNSGTNIVDKWTIVESVGDGNCLAHSILFLSKTYAILQGHTEYNEIVRTIGKMFCTYMANNITDIMYNKVIADWGGKDSLTNNLNNNKEFTNHDQYYNYLAQPGKTDKSFTNSVKINEQSYYVNSQTFKTRFLTNGDAQLISNILKIRVIFFTGIMCQKAIVPNINTNEPTVAWSPNTWPAVAVFNTTGTGHYNVVATNTVDISNYPINNITITSDIANKLKDINNTKCHDWTGGYKSKTRRFRRYRKRTYNKK
jgi:hypothetical protein